MTKRLLFLIAILPVASLAVMAADVSGKWVYEQQGRNGANQATLDLKVSGNTLTGTATGGGGGGGRRGGGGGGGGGRRGGGGGPAEISDGKVDGNNITFSVRREFNGNTNVTNYVGVLNGDELKLKIIRNGQNGQTTTEATAKRSN